MIFFFSFCSDVPERTGYGSGELFGDVRTAEERVAVGGLELPKMLRVICENMNILFRLVN